MSALALNLCPIHPFNQANKVFEFLTGQPVPKASSPLLMLFALDNRLNPTLLLYTCEENLRSFYASFPLSRHFDAPAEMAEALVINALLPEELLPSYSSKAEDVTDHYNTLLAVSADPKSYLTFERLFVEEALPLLYPLAHATHVRICVKSSWWASEKHQMVRRTPGATLRSVLQCIQNDMRLTSINPQFGKLMDLHATGFILREISHTRDIIDAHVIAPLPILDHSHWT